ncbi:MAG: disulfide bond formation protein B [Acetobacteraceae bacterium]
MTWLAEHRAALAATCLSALALGGALASETWLGLVPCALCLWERWPYRIAIGLGIAALLLPRFRRVLLGLMAMCALAAAGLAAVHVGVEQGWWPSPLPECAAPALGGGSIAERLARMPALPAKPCDEPTYLLPGLPVSMAAMNLLFALALSLFLAMSAAGRRSGR